jgi:guanine deaminase
MKEIFMLEAIRLSLEMMRQGRGGPFGTVVVKEGVIVGRGWNEVTSSNDPTAHAEIVAIRAACRELNTFRLDGCEVYTSCEPCPMCLSALYWARVKRVFFAANRVDAADAGFDDDFLYGQLALPVTERDLPIGQMLRKEATVALKEWRLKADKIPY